MAGDFFLQVFGEINLLLQCRFLDECVEAGLLAGGGVFLDDVLLGGLVETLDGELELRLRSNDIICFYRFACFLDGTFENTLRYFVALGLLGSDAHVFLGGILDRHKASLRE